MRSAGRQKSAMLASVMPHLNVGAQKWMVLGPAGWFQNAIRRELEAAMAATAAAGTQLGRPSPPAALGISQRTRPAPRHLLVLSSAKATLRPQVQKTRSGLIQCSNVKARLSACKPLQGDAGPGLRLCPQPIHRLTQLIQASAHMLSSYFCASLSCMPRRANRDAPAALHPPVCIQASSGSRNSRHSLRTQQQKRKVVCDLP